MSQPTSTAPRPSPAWNGVTTPSRRGGSGRLLTDVLVELEIVGREQMDATVAAADASGVTPEHRLLAEGAITPDELARAMAERFGLDHVDLKVFRIDPDAAKLVSAAGVKRYQAVPVAFVNEHTLLVAMADPANVLAIDDIAVMTGYEVRPAVASPADIALVLERLDDARYLADAGLPVLDDPVPEPPDPRDAETRPYEVHEHAPIDFGATGEDASVISLVHRVITEAAERGASDIHFEPQDGDMRVRYRIDGVLQEAAVVPRDVVPAVTSRVKILADLDIAERRLPQDGRIGMDVAHRHVDLRVATLPTPHGENVVMRILDQSNAEIALEQLGMLPQALERYTRAFSQAHGAVLVTGPTGSGKSTSLYAAVNVLNTVERNIITIEDPVEFQVEGVTQVQVNPKAGLSFASGLRSMMRCDPDVIMVGEIRDRETAQIAVESALTGHLVLSTLHTNDAPGAISRLIEMGIEPFLVGSAVDCVVAQRLARLLCDECKEPTTIPAHVMRANGFAVASDFECYQPAGCGRCAGSGYKGRIGLYEVMEVSDTIRSMAVARETTEAIGRVAVEEGMLRLRDDGLEKVARGLTSVAEVARVSGSR